MASEDKASAVRRRLALADRSTLVRLAKENGIKGNLASKVIVEKLIEKGYGMDSSHGSPRQPTPPSSALSPSKRKIESEISSPSKRPCVDVSQPGPSSLKAPQQAEDSEISYLPPDHPYMQTTYRRVCKWRLAVQQALTTEELSTTEKDPAGYFTPLQDLEFECPDHTREFQCYNCVSAEPPTVPSRQPRQQALPPSLARLLNPEWPAEPSRHTQRTQFRFKSQDPQWDELEPTDSSSVRHLRLRPAHQQQSPQSPHPHILASSHPRHAQVSALRPHASALPSSRTISHSHSLSFGRTTDSLERTTPSHSYPNTPTPAAAPPPIHISRGGELSAPYQNQNDEGLGLGYHMQSQPCINTVDPLFLGQGPLPLKTPLKLFQPVTNRFDNSPAHPYYCPRSHDYYLAPLPRHAHIHTHTHSNHYQQHHSLPTPATTNSYTYPPEPPPSHLGHSRPTLFGSAMPYGSGLPREVSMKGANENFELIGMPFTAPAVGATLGTGVGHVAYAHKLPQAYLT